MSNNIALICDSVANMPKEIIERYNIDIVSLTTIIDGVEYKDTEIDSEEFYALMRNSSNIPKTSQATYVDFMDVFSKHIQEGKDILYISASSKATGTYQSAMLAKKDIDGEVCVFDSMSLSFGCGILVLEAAKMIEKGMNIEEIVARLEILRDKSFLILAPNSLEYLQKGGRLSAGKAIVGTMLNVKPILVTRDGMLTPELQVRGSKKVIPAIIKLAKDIFGDDFSEKTIGIGCGDNMEEFEKLKSSVLNELKPKELITLRVNSSNCSHTGPGVLGLTCV